MIKHQRSPAAARFFMLRTKTTGIGYFYVNTVNFLNHFIFLRYQGNVEEREEGGTPDIIADIRLGLVMHVKQSIGVILNIL